MQIKMKMPDLATSASVVTILKWLVEVGQPIKRGQPLLEIETDKAAMEVESFASGTLSAVHFRADDEVKVGAVIATIEVADTAVAAPAPSRAQATPAASTAASTAETEPAQQRPPRSRPAGGMFARNRAAAADKRDDDPNPKREEDE